MSKNSLSQRKKEKTINIVMHDALHYFERNGYDNTTVEQLCQEAMISSSTFFNYFGTKEKVVEIIMEDGLEDYRDYSRTAFDGKEDPFDGLKAALDFEAGAIEKYCNIVSVFHRLALQNEAFKTLEKEYLKVSGELVKKAYELSGRECPYDLETIKELIGGYFIIPFICYPLEEAGKNVRKITDGFVRFLKNS